MRHLWTSSLPSTELHLLDSTAHDVFNCKYDVFNLLLTSLARDAYALGSTKVEVDVEADILFNDAELFEQLIMLLQQRPNVKSGGSWPNCFREDI